MTTTDDDLKDVRRGRQIVSIVLALLIAVPALFLRIATPSLPHVLEAVLFGLAIVGAAFLLSWAAEVAQLDISAGLAIALLALIAVLPEYAVDLVFAKEGGQSFAKYGMQCQSTIDKLAALGLTAMAAPVLGAGGTAIAALSISGPTARLTSDRIAQLAPLLVEEANGLAARLGHHHDERGAA